MAGSGTAHLRDDSATKVLQVEHMVVEFPTTRGTVHAVSDVSLDLVDGETLGIVGESGCGKSTTGKAIMRVPPPTSGQVLLEGVDLASLGTDQMRIVRTQLQMIFQDAISSLNPRAEIRDVVAEPLVIRWLESFRRSPVIRAWERYVPAMLKLWRQPWIKRILLPVIAAFFAGLMVWVIATALSDVNAEGIRDGGAGAAVGNVLMVGSLILASPFIAMFVVTGAIWLVLSILMPFSAIPRAIRVRRDKARFWAETEVKVRQVLEDVGIDPDAAMDRRPHEFSGGQAQRISIARALILDPKVHHLAEHVCHISTVCHRTALRIGLGGRVRVENEAERRKVRVLKKQVRRRTLRRGRGRRSALRGVAAGARAGRGALPRRRRYPRRRRQ